MNPQDIQSFFADESSIDREDHVIFTYLMETPSDPFGAAAGLCRETSTAQWCRPGVDEDLRKRHAARVLDLETLSDSSSSVLGVKSASGDRFSISRVRIAHPHCNFGTKIPNLLTVAMGEGAFFSHGVSSVKLADIELPDSYVEDFQGPQFGAEGIRDILKVYDRPIFFGVVKPNIGLDSKSFAALSREAWMGGLDAAKDDEMLADVSYSPFAERMRLVGEARRESEESTGEKKIFIANITDETDKLIELHDIAVKNGINAVMVNVMAVGLSSIRMLRKHSSVPIVAHFDCIAPMSRHPNFGVSTTVMTKLERLCGCDAIIMPGFGARMMTPDEEVIANAAECTKPLGHAKAALPVPGGSDWAGTLPLMYEKLRTYDFAMVPGRGVFGHPKGPRAGATSLRQAWDAMSQKIDLEIYSRNHAELRDAIAAFGGAGESDPGKNSAGSNAALPIIKGFTGATIQLRRN